MEDDFEAFIQKHLDNDVAIIIEIGNEKLRYLTGVCSYISPKKIICQRLGFDRKVIEKLGFNPDHISPPEY